MTTTKETLASDISAHRAIDRTKQGNAEGFEALYGLHKRRVYSLCLRMTGNAAEAEDLTQDAFLQAFRKIETFRGESAFSTWLHRMTVNVVLMHLRKKRVPEVSLDERDPHQEDGSKKDVGSRDTVLAGSIDRVNLGRAIERLPAGYRMTFILHDVDGYEHNEIAEMMGRTIGNSKSQLHKARMKLRGLLQPSSAERSAQRVVGENKAFRAAKPRVLRRTTPTFTPPEIPDPREYIKERPCEDQASDARDYCSRAAG